MTRIADLLAKDRNVQKRTQGVGVTTPELVRSTGLIGPVARAAGVSESRASMHLRGGLHRREASDVGSRQGSRRRNVRRCLP